MLLVWLVTKPAWIFLQIAGHSILAAILWSRARSVDLTSKAAITSFYMFIWKVINNNPIPQTLAQSTPHPPWKSKHPADCTGRPNRLRIRSPSLDPGGRPLAAWDQLLTIYSPHVAPQLFYAEYLLIPLVRWRPGDGDGGTTTPREDFERRSSKRPFEAGRHMRAHEGERMDWHLAGYGRRPIKRNKIPFPPACVPHAGLMISDVSVRGCV